MARPLGHDNDNCSDRPNAQQGYHVAIVSLFGCNSGVTPMFSFEQNKGLDLDHYKTS